MVGIPRNLRRTGVPEEYLGAIIREMAKRTEDISSDEASAFAALMTLTQNETDVVSKITEGVQTATQNEIDRILAQLFTERSYVSNNLNISAIASPTLPSTEPIFGIGAKFNGSTQRLESSASFDHSNFGTSTDFTLAAHIRTSGNTLAVINKGDVTGAHYLLGIDASGKAYASGYGSSLKTITGGTTVNDNNPHSIVASFNRAGNLSLFVDGASDATPVSLSGMGDINNSKKLYVATRDSGGTLGQYFSGTIALPTIIHSTAWVLADAQSFNAGQVKMAKTILYMLLDTDFVNTPDGTFPFVLV